MNRGASGEILVGMEVDLAPLPLVVREARRKARAEFTGKLEDERLHDVLLLVSEVVTNAVVHGYPPGRLRLSSDDARVRVEVEDSSPAQPVLEAFDHESHRGRGIALVEALADDWGVEAPGGQGSGKRVWFEVNVQG
jgi:anti-sigma regulatory factor (Ser/Thr protein kinase)